MFNSLLNGGEDWHWLVTSPVMLVLTGFQVWMLVHAVRNREWVWTLFIFIGWGFAALWYYLYIYRTADTGMDGFELPGAQRRQRIQELQAKIHHLDHAYHHFQLGDVYFQRGKLADAEKCYRTALEREPKDIDAQAHLGQCLLRLNRPAEARPLLDTVCRENYKHDFGHSLMAYAETLAALGDKDAAFDIWQHVVENHSYPRAKVQFAELCVAKNQNDLARAQLTDVIKDDMHAPGYQRRRDRPWVRKAKGLLVGLEAKR